MTSKLPFDLTTKPTSHYFEHGVIRFNMAEGKLFFTVKVITKLTNGIVLQKEVRSKEHLSKLLSVKSLSELQTIEVVSQ